MPNSSYEDYFDAAIEEGELAMRPHCRCGHHLDEDFHCPQCDRHCHCTLIVCHDNDTLERVRDTIDQLPQFARFTVRLIEE